MSKNKIIKFLFVLVIAFYLIRLNENEVIFYVLFGNSEIEKIDVDVLIDDKLVFQDKIENIYFKVKMVKAKINSGIHELEIRAKEQGIIQKQYLLILFNQHIVIEFFSPCSEKENCFQIRNRLLKFRLE